MMLVRRDRPRRPGLVAVVTAGSADAAAPAFSAMCAVHAVPSHHRTVSALFGSGYYPGCTFVIDSPQLDQNVLPPPVITAMGAVP